ncbi:MAG: AzlD domain-containing protein [Halofilum sp. (in: g-proteobacteria)]
MILRPEVVLLIAGCMLVTLVPRVLPLLGARRLRLPPLAIAWLGYVPVAVIAALLAGELVLADGRLPATVADPRLLAGMVTLGIAFASRSIMLTVIGGMATFALLSALLAG